MRKYQKPLLRREKGMRLILKAIRDTSPRIACRQCSSCHGCR